MAPRVTNYTSISLSKTHLPLLNELKDYAQRELKTTVTSQMVTDFAIELAVEHKDRLLAYVEKHTEDPQLAELRRLDAAREKLISALAKKGLAPDSK